MRGVLIGVHCFEKVNFFWRDSRRENRAPTAKTMGHPTNAGS
jgi:hypothetical protein